MSITISFNNKQDTVKFAEAHLIWKVSLKFFFGACQVQIVFENNNFSL